MPVGDMLDQMSSSEMTEWMAIASVEPIGNDRLDMLFGILYSLIVNMMRSGNEKPPALPSDFLPWHDKVEVKPKVLSPDEIAQQARMVLGALTK